MGKRARRLLISILLGVAVFVIVYVFSLSEISQSFDRYTYDYRFRLRGARETHPDIVLVGIDDKCVETLGKKCWQVRFNHAHMLDYISNYPPKVIGFDILFIGRETVEEYKTHDQALLQIIDYFDTGTVCMAYNFVFPDDRQDSTTERKVELLSEFEEEQQDSATEREIELLDRFVIKKVSGDLSRIQFLEDVSLPFEELSRLTDLGFINAPRDPYGGVRRLPMVIGLKLTKNGGTETYFYPSLSLLMSCRHLGVPLDDIEVEIGREIRIPQNDGPDIRVPIDAEGYLLINFFDKHSGFNPLSLAQLIKWGQEGSDMGAELVEDKLLIVGLTATGSTDEDQTPLSPFTPLITVHLNAINSILTNDFIYKSPEWADIVILLILCIGLGLCNGYLAPIKSTIVTALVLAAYIFSGYGTFIYWSIIVPVVPPVAAIILVYSITMFYRFLSEERQKKWVRKVLGQYLSANVMQEVLEDPERLKLGGTRKELTVLFSDILGFTSICEKLRAEEVVQILNEYLDKMTECIFRHSGTLDKYVGDEIVAFFGAPGSEHDQDHPEHAVLAALDMRDELARLHEKWESEGKEKFKAGIGINTGEMIVGNMGSSNIFDYTVIGDEVNLGARIEQLTRTHDVQIIIAESTCKRVKHIVEVVEIGVEKVKGREKDVRIYEIRGPKKQAS